MSSSHRQGRREPGAVTLVTGAAGFVGTHLVPWLQRSGRRVVGLRKPGTPAGPGGLEWIAADLREPAQTRAAIDAVRPAQIVHLAAVAFPPDAERDPLEALRLNYAGVENLLRAVAELVPRARLLYVSTAQVYGAQPADAPPIREDAPLVPASLYSATKVAAERRLELASERDGLDVVRARPFNHSGPGGPRSTPSRRSRGRSLGSSEARPSRRCAWETWTSCGTSSTWATWCARTSCCSTEASRGASTTWQPAADVACAPSSTICSRAPTPTCGSRSIPRDTAPSRRTGSRSSATAAAWVSSAGALVSPSRRRWTGCSTTGGRACERRTCERRGTPPSGRRTAPRTPRAESPARRRAARRRSRRAPPPGSPTGSGRAARGWPCGRAMASARPPACSRRPGRSEAGPRSQTDPRTRRAAAARFAARWRARCGTRPGRARLREPSPRRGAAPRGRGSRCRCPRRAAHLRARVHRAAVAAPAAWWRARPSRMPARDRARSRESPAARTTRGAPRAARCASEPGPRATSRPSRRPAPRAARARRCRAPRRPGRGSAVSLRRRARSRPAATSPRRAPRIPGFRARRALPPDDPTRPAEPGCGSRGSVAASLLRVAGLALGVALVTACSKSAYLAHVSAGQARLLWDREEIDEALIARLSERERDGLASVERALAKANRLGLESSSSYRHLIDRGGAPLVTLVIAAPPDRVEATRWWFPIVGHVPYLGYFDSERARRSAERLAGRGLDTFVRPALMYSTLGWFDDPLPLGLLRRDRIDIFDILVHERVHESVFVPGDVAYNEALATLIAEHATLELLADDDEALARARERFADRRRFADLMDRLARELEALYQTLDAPEEARRARQALFQRFQGQEFERLDWETPLYQGFAGAELSNAYVVAHRTYFADLPCLERELLELGGDLAELVRRHREAPGRRLDPERQCAPLADE